MRSRSSLTLPSMMLRLIMIPILFVGIFGFSSSPAYAVDAVIYVDGSASGTNNGTSWQDAYTDLQSAISTAASSDQIWVAAGTYYPTTGVDRTVSFTLKNGVSIYGGFDGTETLLSGRDPATNITILSGDIGTSGNLSDNSYHVVNGGGTDKSATLDGFTITKGNADLVDVGSQEQYGSGMYNASSSPTLNNLIFTQNTTPRYGAGMYNNASSPKLNNVLFINNTAQRAGGLYNTNFSNPELTNVIFLNNTASSRGGGMTTAEDSAPQLMNVTFSGNTAPRGAAIHNTSGFPTLINVTISGNTASVDGGGLYNESSTPTLTNVTISNNSAVGSGGGIYNDNSDPVITNSIIYGNTNDEVYDLNSTPDLTNSIVEGGCPSGANCTNVLDQNPLLGLLANNGGFTKTMAPGVGSPAIDAGTDTGCPVEDQRGYSRPQSAHCDIGSVEVDNQAPITILDSFPPDPDSDNTPTFTFSGDDGGGSGVTSFLCRIDAASYVPCTSPFTSSPLSADPHTFEVYAVDNASNADPTPASHAWTLEFTPTLVSSIARTDASPTSAASVDFTVTFSANVTGVDSGDFTLTTSGVSGAAITGVSGSNNTYTVSVNTGANNGTIRLDVTGLADIDDSVGNSPTNLPYTSGETYKIIKNGTFVDVPNTYWAWRWIESFFDQGITTGCTQSPLNYCPERQVTRAEMAVFILRAKYGSDYQPDPSQTGIFADVPVTNKEWMQPWIEQFYEDGITTGCTQSPLNYCPERQVTRAEMAVFILRALYGSSYQPDPSQTDIFADVPVTNKEWMQPWIEQFYEDGITTGCLSGPLRYCPERPVTRAEMSVFIDRAFNIPPLP